VATPIFASFGAHTVATNLGSPPGAAIRRPPSLLSSFAICRKKCRAAEASGARMYRPRRSPLIAERPAGYRVSASDLGPQPSPPGCLGQVVTGLGRRLVRKNGPRCSPDERRGVAHFIVRRNNAAVRVGFSHRAKCSARNPKMFSESKIVSRNAGRSRTVIWHRKESKHALKNAYGNCCRGSNSDYVTCGTGKRGPLLSERMS